MIKTYVRVYDERTGNPDVDNRNRHKNRALNSVCRRTVRFVTPHGRRRKKILTRVEYGKYARLVASVADQRGL